MNVAYTIVINLLLRLSVVWHAIEAKVSILLCIALFASFVCLWNKRIFDRRLNCNNSYNPRGPNYIEEISARNKRGKLQALVSLADELLLFLRGNTTPWSHSVPVKPAGHKHLNPPCLFTQLAPFLHGLYGAHSFTSVKIRQVETVALLRLQQIRKGWVLSEHLVIRNRSFCSF